MSHAAKPPAPRERSVRKGASPFAAGLVASALLHWVVLRLYPVLAGGPPDAGVRVQRSAPALRAIQAVRIVEAEQGDPSGQDEPVEIDASVPESAAPQAPALDGPRFGFPSGYRPAAERLRAGQGDPRLWLPVAPELVEPTPDELLRMEILVALEAMADSAAAVDAALRRATDWTHTDAEGRKWGAQDGVVYLGGVPLPVPFGFAGRRDYNGELAARAFRFNDIDRAAGTRAVQLTWKERLEFMKLRREAQRAAEQAEKESAQRRTPPSPRPDTLGRRGLPPASSAQRPGIR